MLPDPTALSLMPPAFDPASIPREQIPALIAALAARLLEPAPSLEPAPDQPDKMLTTLEAAAILRRSVKWLYRHQKTLPFARKLSDRSWVYSEQGLRKWLARQRA
jgi:predicted DNA-binding transcriptional regulator AlpA